MVLCKIPFALWKRIDHRILNTSSSLAVGNGEEEEDNGYLWWRKWSGAATKEVSGLRERLGLFLGYGEAEGWRVERGKRKDRTCRGGLEIWMLKIALELFVVFISLRITRTRMLYVTISSGANGTLSILPFSLFRILGSRGEKSSLLAFGLISLGKRTEIEDWCSNKINYLN